MSKALTRSDKTKVYEYERSNLYEYEEASEKIRPLALVLFAGKEFVSDIICFGQSLKGSYRRNQERVQRVFSHVGVIVDKNIMPGIRNTLPGRHYVLESTASGKLVSEVVDCESMKGVLGVQIRDFEWVCATYNGVIAVANLQDNPFDPIEGESVEENQQRIGMLRGMPVKVPQRTLPSDVPDQHTEADLRPLSGLPGSEGVLPHEQEMGVLFGARGHVIQRGRHHQEMRTARQRGTHELPHQRRSP